MRSPAPSRSSATIRVNGREVPLRASVLSELIAELGHGERRGIAVALNGEVVPRSDWKAAVLRPGDAVEIVGAVQGG
jgi:sulfur carrier protein